MDLLYQLVANILALFYAAIPNYAVAIVLLTILVMAITTPLVLKSTRSMMVMQQLQPEMKKIQARYKDDRQKQNEELLKFYKENNINPVGSCIPLLVQMPVFFFLYAVLRGLTRRVSDLGYSVGFNTGQTAVNANLTTAPPWLNNFDPAYLDPNSTLYHNLSATNTMQAFGMDLSQSLTETWSRSGAIASIPYVLLIAVVGFTSFYQQRQIQGRNPNAVMNPQQQTLMKIMPVILPVISLNLPAALVLYFAVSNLWRVGLQAFISHSIYGIKRGEGGPASGPTDKEAPKAPKPSPPGNGKAQGKPRSEKPQADRGGQKKSGARDAGANGRKKQPVTGASSGQGSGTNRPNSKKNASTAKARTPSRTQSGSGSRSGGGGNPSLQPRARKPKKR